MALKHKEVTKRAIKALGGPAKGLRVSFAVACCVVSVPAVKTKKSLGGLGLRSGFAHLEGNFYIEHMKKHDGYRRAGAAGEAWGHVLDNYALTRPKREAFAGHETNPRKAKRKRAYDSYMIKYTVDKMEE
jgi:hypothetical protein